MRTRLSSTEESSCTGLLSAPDRKAQAQLPQGVLGSRCSQKNLPGSLLEMCNLRSCPKPSALSRGLQVIRVHIEIETHCPRTCSVVKKKKKKKDLCQLLSHCPIIHSLTVPNPPFHTLFCNAGARTPQTTFLLCQLLAIQLCQQDPCSSGVCVKPPQAPP